MIKYKIRDPFSYIYLNGNEFINECKNNELHKKNIQFYLTRKSKVLTFFKVIELRKILDCSRKKNIYSPYYKILVFNYYRHKNNNLLELIFKIIKSKESI